ncbi:MAG: tRNA uridine-5-carboxymethylaminomethyl(34) synthesis GTPase MnmE [Candidatus Marinimicrobia bacterium]|nr:tRNA uridine-5-carboxymethylaminomethyl(34) synthesis GTPase MnmE [Candidatus Neomarinimicrobiota bacterium]
MSPEDTIVAPATPFGVGGISVVRLSGLGAVRIASLLTKHPKLQNRQAVYLSLHDKTGSSFERGVLTFFKSPASYTGEDVVEISCHGNPLLVQKIVDICCAFGARIADPGEFTLRAFLNGKIDLIQAESVSGIIHAQSIEAAALNHNVLSGKLSEQFNFIQNNIIEILSHVEYVLDVSEEDLPKDYFTKLNKMFPGVLSTLKKLRDSYKIGKLLTDGALVVIAGEPNVGKSTLLNALSESNRAITAPSPGTTRDSIEVRLVLDGVPLRMVDTAGIRSSKNSIEAEGVRRTKKLLSKADLALIVIDPDTEMNPVLIKFLSCPYITVYNKADIKRPTVLNDDVKYISALTGAGIKNLKSSLRSQLGTEGVSTKLLALTTARQFHSIKKCHEAIVAAHHLLSDDVSELELGSFELRSALNALDVVLGKTTPDDILDNVFGAFCVGK